jgi:predicted deacylase
MFAPDYLSARDRFRRLAPERIDSLPISVRGPGGEPLTIDIAWIGATEARRILLVTSGLHGIEGFAGSAMQCALLSDPPAMAPSCALVLVHALNPWGFAHLRRVNENNVDLNRNFLAAGEDRAGMPPLYATLDPLLNPRSPPAADAFLLRMAAYIARYGFAACRQAIAEGQYEIAHGLFYGGQQLEEGPARVVDWLRRSMPQASRVLVLDLHTGLGRFGVQTLLAEPDMPAERAARLGRLLTARVQGGAGVANPGGFSARGALASAVRESLSHANPEFFTVEHGTYSGLKLVHALREENRWHHYGDGSLMHESKQRLAEMFAPASERWRSSVLAAGDRLLRVATMAIAAE